MSAPALLTAGLVSDIDQICRTHCHGVDEVEMVARLFRSPLALRDWRAALNAFFVPQGQVVKYNAVFCHQRPRVRLSPPPGCELADALLVFTNRTTQTRQAILLQAKRGMGWPPNTRHKQWHLYSKWPTFSYRVGSSKIRKSRTLSPATTHWGQYLLVQQKGPADLAVPSVGSKPTGFAAEVAKMVFGSPAHSFCFSPLSQVTDWDKLIWDLLLGIGILPLPEYNWAAKIASRRGHGVIFSHSKMNVEVGFGGSGPGYFVTGETEDDFRGFTVVMIEFGSEEEMSNF